MEYGLQHAAGDGERLVGNREAMLPRAAGIHVARLHPGKNREAVWQDASQAARDLRAQRHATHIRDDVACGDHLADQQTGMEYARSRRIKHALLGITIHAAGHAGCWQAEPS